MSHVRDSGKSGAEGMRGPFMTPAVPGAVERVGDDVYALDNLGSDRGRKWLQTAHSSQNIRGDRRSLVPPGSEVSETAPIFPLADIADITNNVDSHLLAVVGGTS